MMDYCHTEIGQNVTRTRKNDGNDGQKMQEVKDGKDADEEKNNG